MLCLTVRTFTLLLGKRWQSKMWLQVSSPKQPHSFHIPCVCLWSPHDICDLWVCSAVPISSTRLVGGQAAWRSSPATTSALGQCSMWSTHKHYKYNFWLCFYSFLQYVTPVCVLVDAIAVYSASISVSVLLELESCKLSFNSPNKASFIAWLYCSQL